MLYVGDDWAEDHHNVELIDQNGRRLAKARLPEGVAGIARLHAMIAEQLGEDTDEADVLIGIETERGPWVAALLAAGYTVYAVNPLQAARYRERQSVSGAKSDKADAHTLADMVRTDAHQLRAIAGDSLEVEAIKVVARTHKTMIWERTRHVLRLRHGLREYLPAALEAFDDLDAADTFELLRKAPEPVSAAKLTSLQIRAALKRARRRDIDTKVERIQSALRSEQLGRHKVITSAYAATTRSTVAVLVTLNEQIKVLQGQVETHFGKHPDAEIIMSQPGMGPLLGAPVLAEFGDAPRRYVDAKARKNYAGTSPITRASGKKKVLAARFVHNDRLIDALILQAQAALRASSGARAYYDKQRDRGLSHNAALRQLTNRLVGILHGCLKTRTNYNESTAWPQHKDPDQQHNDPDQQNAA
ncbi:MAG: IS110 family transposase [Mycobacterium sp.]|nr:IS110 family transposase [Mycobacterium sp.]